MRGPTRAQFERYATWTISDADWQPTLWVDLHVSIGAVRVAFLPAPTLQYCANGSEWRDL
jgi:hypothetical protein